MKVTGIIFVQMATVLALFCRSIVGIYNSEHTILMWLFLLVCIIWTLLIAYQTALYNSDLMSGMEADDVKEKENEHE